MSETELLEEIKDTDLLPSIQPLREEKTTQHRTYDPNEKDI